MAIIEFLIALYAIGYSVDVQAYEKPEPEVIELIYAEVSAYTARPQETDSTPFITASGQRVREGIVANNCLPFGSKVEIDGREYEVQDRMNKRYSCNHYDIFMWDYDEAIRFGRQRLIVKVL